MAKRRDAPGTEPTHAVNWDWVLEVVRDAYLLRKTEIKDKANKQAAEVSTCINGGNQRQDRRAELMFDMILAKKEWDAATLLAAQDWESDTSWFEKFLPSVTQSYGVRTGRAAPNTAEFALAITMALGKKRVRTILSHCVQIRYAPFLLHRP